MPESPNWRHRGWKLISAALLLFFLRYTVPEVRPAPSLDFADGLFLYLYWFTLLMLALTGILCLIKAEMRAENVAMPVRKRSRKRT